MTVPPRSLLSLVVLVLGMSAAAQAWHAHREAAVAQEVAELSRPGDIRMLASDTCSVCHTARQWMEANGVRYGECSIERDPQCAQLFQATMAPGTPVMLVRGQVQVGFQPPRMLEALRESR